jgi:hypothetical protein
MNFIPPNPRPIINPLQTNHQTKPQNTRNHPKETKLRKNQRLLPSPKTLPNPLQLIIHYN